VLLSFWKKLFNTYLDWVFSWFLNLKSWILILILGTLILKLDSILNSFFDSWDHHLLSWSLKCTWFNLELILWFLRSSSLLSLSVLDFWAFCHHLCYHQNSLNQSWFIMKLASTKNTSKITWTPTIFPYPSCRKNLTKNRN